MKELQGNQALQFFAIKQKEKLTTNEKQIIINQK